MKISFEDAVERVYANKAQYYKGNCMANNNELKKIIYNLREQVEDAYEKSKNH